MYAQHCKAAPRRTVIGATCAVRKMRSTPSMRADRAETACARRGYVVASSSKRRLRASALAGLRRLGLLLGGLLGGLLDGEVPLDEHLVGEALGVEGVRGVVPRDHLLEHLVDLRLLLSRHAQRRRRPLPRRDEALHAGARSRGVVPTWLAVRIWEALGRCSKEQAEVE
eukprot:1989936-Pleurochrysis_carterae.AAC.1